MPSPNPADLLGRDPVLHIDPTINGRQLDEPFRRGCPVTAPVRSARASRDRLRVGLVAPPWVEVPPTGYGGIESMVDALARGLAGRGHDVRLFTVGSSTCPVDRGWIHAEPPGRIGADVAGLRHALAAYEQLQGCE
jgi:hypothetical protein